MHTDAVYGSFTKTAETYDRPRHGYKDTSIQLRWTEVEASVDSVGNASCSGT